MANFDDAARFHFFDRVQLWFSHDGNLPSERTTAGNIVVLSEAFYREMEGHPVPVEREVVAALAHAPGLLDFYIWLAWKSWVLKDGSASIPLTDRNGLSQQLGTKEYSDPRFFRSRVKRWIHQVKSLWPECPAQISQDGRALIVWPSGRSAAIRVAKTDIGKDSV